LSRLQFVAPFVASARWLIIAACVNCAHSNPCAIPPQTVSGFVRLACDTYPEHDAQSCQYLGYNEDGDLCLSSVVSLACGEWHVFETDCDFDVQYGPAGHGDTL
jgi:hypothetical protein